MIKVSNVLIISGIALSFYFSSAITVNEIADRIISQLYEVRFLIINMAYICGLGFLFASFFKFKQHKDNPTQNPVGNPIMYLILGVFLMYMGNFEMPLKETLFGSGDAPGEDSKMCPAGQSFNHDTKRCD